MSFFCEHPGPMAIDGITRGFLCWIKDILQQSDHCGVTTSEATGDGSYSLLIL